ncbi:PREDICTED: AT-hook motif nuclear-localized protein 8-like [Nicotiana attenuata]|uniref:AT-hook motif nuclear-localized protein n=1 Tax=Nicotiana attenuata TaxID=49451 RepID=A0A1J6IYQ8_NICAT|nr:PREDICTED: AT-hook motif nuclear-localized protein 8-like [Nicotiana attenuata]OIT03907.1 at-hook motif nuclear-localized protein 8 [Nicotiana attenuata]
MENTFKTSASQTSGEMNTEQLAAAVAGVNPPTVSPAVAQNTHLSFASPAPRPYPSAEAATGTGAQVAQNTQLSFASPLPRQYPSAEGATVTGAQVAQNRRLSFASPPPRPYPSAEGATGTGVALSNVNVNSSERVTKKRGRPRKNGSDGSIAFGPMAAASASAAVTPPQGPVSSAAAQPVSEGGPSKKPRGRPPGSCGKQRRRTFGSAGSGITLTPHVITVEKGEDIGGKIVSFTRQAARSVSIMSAHGVVSKVVLVRADETETHEGQFDIVSLSGSFRESIIGDEDSWTGAINIAVTRDGLVLGGNVIGDLTAASQVEIILGTFVDEERANSPPAHGTFGESSGRQGSPFNHGDNNANMQGMPSMP